MALCLWRKMLKTGAHPAFPDLFPFFTRLRFLILHVGFTITSFSDEDEKNPDIHSKNVKKEEKINMNLPPSGGE